MSQKSNPIFSGGIFVTFNDKWEAFLKSGTVASYLSYAKEKNKKALECENKNEPSNSGVNNKGNGYWGKR